MFSTIKQHPGNPFCEYCKQQMVYDIDMMENNTNIFHVYFDIISVIAFYASIFHC